MSAIRATLASFAAVALVGVLAGCGGPEPEPAGDAAPTSEDTESSPAEPESSEKEPESSAAAEEPAEEPAEEVVITIEEFMYSKAGPVAPGTEVTIENTDAEVHTVTAEGKGGFDLTIAPGASETLSAPDQPGRYPYLCSFHAGMTATLVVE